jgi:hypothetical protein
MKVSLFAALLLSLASLSGAEPSPSVQYLMNEPVTLFDWGIVRLHEYLEEYTTHYLQTAWVQDIYATVSYDSRRNIILLSIVATRQARKTDESPESIHMSSKDICRGVTRTLRKEFLTDRDRSVRRSLGIYRFFGHVGFRGKDEPLDAFEEIERITVIKVSVYSDRDPGRLILESESPLMGQEIFFGGSK